jgi:hypothetical protein
MAGEPDGREPVLFELWLRAYQDGDYAEAQRLRHELMGRATRPKPGGKDEHLTPPRALGTTRRRAHAGRRSIGHR